MAVDDGSFVLSSLLIQLMLVHEMLSCSDLPVTAIQLVL